jgi:hypothetical protein
MWYGLCAIGERNTAHHLDLGDAPFFVEADQVDALQFLAVDRGAEFEHHVQPVGRGQLAVVGEVLEHVKPRSKGASRCG